MDQNHTSIDLSLMQAPFIAISRHRLGIDGEGVTTLVAFQGCPLRCKYCLNMQCWNSESTRYILTPEQLYSKVKIDDLYFRTTHGGICFGGGEPAMYYDFIKRFKEIVPPYWEITMETSLNVPKQNIESLIGIVDSWIIDIKDMDSEIYLKYTSKDNSPVRDNLILLSEAKVPCLIRVPLIPQFNTKEQCGKSIETLKKLGFDRFEQFKYVIRKQKQQKQPDKNKQHE